MMNKKMIRNLTVTGVAFSALMATTFAGTIPKVNLNDNKILLQKSPFIEKGYTYLPLRAISDNMGIDVGWDGTIKTVTLKQGFNTITCREGSTAARVNNQIVQMPVPVKIVKGTTYVPVRFVSEVMGAELSYDGKSNTVDIKYDMPEGIDLDMWGRIIRKDNLPKNAKDYPWILKAVPNDMYEMKFDYQNFNWKVKPVDGVNYYSPKNITNHPWVTEDYYEVNGKYKELVEKNLDMRLNHSYKNIDNGWYNNMLSNYVQSEHLLPKLKPHLKGYVDYVKKNKIVFEGDYFVEPSTVHGTPGHTYRCWVRFRATSPKLSKIKMFNSYIGDSEIKSGVWYSGYCDISIGSSMGGDCLGEYIGTNRDRIVDSCNTVNLER